MAHYVERSVIIVRPQRPFADWANACDDDGPRYELIEHWADPNAYLVDNPRDSENLNELLRHAWPQIFEEELSSWMTDSGCWPQRRTRAMFEQWFACELVTTVLDLGTRPLDA